MNERQPVLASIAAARFVAALTAGSDVFFYWGDDRADVLERVAVARFGLIGANLDTEVFLIPAANFPAVYERLRCEVGQPNLHFVGEARRRLLPDQAARPAADSNLDDGADS